MAITEVKGEPIFLHTLLPGGASHSFGVAVAKLAGVPQSVIDKAYEILQTLEYREVEKGKTHDVILHSVQDNNILANRILLKELSNLDLSNMTPLEALNKLAELKDKLKLLTSKSETYLEAD
jgi:DNA mismatch repair protein MutS